MVSQVLVSTLQANATGDVSVFPIPLRFDWLRHLDAKGMTAFFEELLETVWECQQTREWQKMSELLSAWEETAYLIQDPVLLARVEDNEKKGENISYRENTMFSLFLWHKIIRQATLSIFTKL